MRLLNAHDGQLKDFISDEYRPPYAILSHTWGDEEVSLVDWQTARPGLKSMAGYAKIQYCQRQAIENGLDWVWVDTCCIDKSSSADLSECINSMFRWYKEAVVCYAFLADVVRDTDVSVTEENFRRSRWFTRGWTLQELLAPSKLLFYDSGWQLLGSKTEMLHVLSQITGIEIAYLRGQDLQLASVSKRMSWAAHRKTSRLEDIAYCLLGIFQININIRYGEGKRAFHRLQGKIMKMIPYDHTLFAWGTAIDWKDQPRPPALQGPDNFGAGGEYAWDEAEARQPLMGLLAESPYAFRNSGCFIPNNFAADTYRDKNYNLDRPQLINSEVSATFLTVEPSPDFPSQLLYHWIHPRVSQLRPASWVLLFCGNEDASLHSRWLVLPLKAFSSSLFGRTKYLINFPVFNSVFTLLEAPGRRWRLCAGPQIESRLLMTGDILFRRMPMPEGPASSRYMRFRLDASYQQNSCLVQAFGNTSGELVSWCIKADVGHSRGWLVTFSQQPTGSHYLEVILFRICFGSQVEVVDGRGDIWYPDQGADLTPNGAEFLRHRLPQPVGVWQPSTLPFQLKVVAERVPISESGFIDVVDVVVDEAEVRIDRTLRLRNAARNIPPEAGIV